MEFYTAYNRPPRQAIRPVGESKTVQDFCDECDINVILKRALRTGTIPTIPSDLQFGNDDGLTVQERANQIVAVRQYFEGLPSDIRLRFGNSAMEFAAFAADPANEQALVDLGLLPKPPAPVESAPVEPAPEPVGGAQSAQSLS